MIDDTIAAISTPIGKGGIGIVRVSGDKALDIAQRVFKSAKNKDIKLAKSHTIMYGSLINPLNSEIIEEGLLMIMKAPSTYTREDIIELNCHGGILSVKRVLEAVLNSGARLAEPGEFTKRAFLNGRIDLSQAEAVIDIINSQTETFHSSSLNQLGGNLSAKIKDYRTELINLIANIEACIDYPETDIEEITSKTIGERTKNLIQKLDYLIINANTGKIIKDGIKTVILGKPNVGKSSLLNFLLKEQRAIVTDIPGTTRDILEEYINLDGVAIRIIDTAGIRETSDIIEKLGVEKSKQYAEEADLILLMLDNSNPISLEDLEILEFIKSKKYIILINKTDLTNKLEYDKLYKYIDKDDIIKISVKQNSGIDILEAKIKDMFFEGKLNLNDNLYITNVRHKDCLIRAKSALEEVINTINMGMPEDFMSIDLQKAYQILGEIIGESVDEDIIDKIFSEFCLGK